MLERGMRAIHPGELLREDVWPALSAENAHLDTSGFEDVFLEFEPVTAAIAAELERIGAGPARLWLRLQKDFDEAEEHHAKVAGFRYVIEGDEGGYGIYFPDLPGCVSAGRTKEELMKNAEEAIALHTGATGA